MADNIEVLHKIFVDKTKVKDQLGSNPSLTQNIVFNYYENPTIEAGPINIISKTIYNNTSDSFVLGHPQNGVLGVANGIGGHQIYLGDHRGPSVMLRVSNPNNIFWENFRDVLYQDTSNTCTWDITTDYRAEFSGNQICAIKRLFYDSSSIQSIKSIKVNLTSSGEFSINVSPNAKTNWMVVDQNKTYNLTSTNTFDSATFDVSMFDSLGTGSDVYMFITNMSSNSSNYISKIKAEYTL